MSVDELDKRILTEYQKDATASYNALAERLGEASSTVFNRIKRMTQQGVIKAIVPLIDYEAVGKSTTAWIQIGLDMKTDCCKVAEELAERPEIMEVHEIAGEFDILVKVKVENNLALHDLTKTIEVDGITKMASIIAFKTEKEDPRIVILPTRDTKRGEQR